MKSLLLSVLLIKASFSLNCYTTSFNVTETGIPSLEIQNCNDNIKQLLSLQGLPVNHLPEEIIRCYRITAVLEEYIFTMRGCIPEGKCDTLKPVLSNVLDIESDDDRDISCYECAEDLCNVATAQCKFEYKFVVFTLILPVISVISQKY